MKTTNRDAYWDYRYENLRTENNYRSAAIKIRQDGYATDPLYSVSLISIIEQYDLYLWDGHGVDPNRNGNDVVVTASSLNVRNAPGTDSSRIGSLSNGSIVTIGETIGNWGRLTDCDSGWICLDYVRNR